MKCQGGVYLPTGDLLVVDDEPVGHRRGQFDGLQPESHVSLLQNLVVQAVFQRNDCKETGRRDRVRSRGAAVGRGGGGGGRRWRHSLGFLMAWLSSSMVFRAEGDKTNQHEQQRPEPCSRRRVRTEATHRPRSECGWRRPRQCR